MATTTQEQNGQLWSNKTVAASEANVMVKLPEMVFDYGTIELTVSSGTATLQYTLSTQDDLDAGTATWNTYANGTGVTTFTTSIKVEDTFTRGVRAFRFTASGGTSTMVVKI